MRNLTKLFLLAILVVFASCQNETLNEGASSIVEDELALENEILVSDGEEDVTLVLDSNSEIMAERELSFSISSKSTSEGTPVCTPDLEALELSLPETITGETTSKPGTNAYFDLNLFGDSAIAGTGLDAWCVDVAGDLAGNDPNLTFDVYSSYADNIPTNRVDKPENFDYVNWIVNQNFIGQDSPSGGQYTFGDVQWAIWELIDDSNCASCAFLGDDWSVAKGQEIADAALASGDNFVPGCGQKMAVVLIPGDNKQSIIITVDVPEKEEECSDCEGKVTKLELEFDWSCAKYIKIYQRKENTCYGVKIFSQKVEAGETFTIEGANHDGTFGKYAYIYINGCYYTKIKTNCDVNIGPGYSKGVFNVISGESSNGGELCEYVKPDYNKCYRHWGCKYYSKCRYSYGGGH
jgi:hypothetical protein